MVSAALSFPLRAKVGLRFCAASPSYRGLFGGSSRLSPAAAAAANTGTALQFILSTSTDWHRAMQASRTVSFLNNLL